MSGVAWRLRAARPVDGEAIVALVQRAGLPTEDLHDVQPFMVACADDLVIGTAALERYGDVALVRSVAVDPPWRGHGIGGALLDAALGRARAAGVGRAYLLTTTAAEWFAARGFTPVPRAALPPAIAACPQVTRLCPDHATVMVRAVSP